MRSDTGISFLILGGIIVFCLLLFIIIFIAKIQFFSHKKDEEVVINETNNSHILQDDCIAKEDCQNMVVISNAKKTIDTSQIPTNNSDIEVSKNSLLHLINDSDTKDKEKTLDQGMCKFKIMTQDELESRNGNNLEHQVSENRETFLSNLIYINLEMIVNQNLVSYYNKLKNIPKSPEKGKYTGIMKFFNVFYSDKISSKKKSHCNKDNLPLDILKSNTNIEFKRNIAEFRINNNILHEFILEHYTNNKDNCVFCKNLSIFTDNITFKLNVDEWINELVLSDDVLKFSCSDTNTSVVEKVTLSYQMPSECMIKHGKSINVKQYISNMHKDDTFSIECTDNMDNAHYIDVHRTLYQVINLHPENYLINTQSEMYNLQCLHKKN